MRQNRLIDSLTKMTESVDFPQDSDGTFEHYTSALRKVVYENIRGTGYGSTWKGFKWWPEIQGYEMTLELNAGLLPNISGQVVITEYFDPREGVKQEIERLNAIAERMSLYAASSFNTRQGTTAEDIHKAQQKGVGKQLAEAWGYVVD